MILGIGNDLVDIRRIEKDLKKFGARFEKKLFAPEELAYANKRKTAKAATLAKRFAAKEACAKALGTGFTGGISMKNIAVINLANGKPTLRLTGKALKELNSLVPKGMKPAVHITMSDEYPYASAVVILSAEKSK